MAGTYLYAKSKKELIKKMDKTTPYGAKVHISRAPSLDKKGKKAYYTIVDVISKSGKHIWHN